jgi:hypothetical protein
LPWDGLMVRLVVFLRKAFVAMVNIDKDDGRLQGPIASRLAPTLECGELDNVGASLLAMRP